MLKQFVTYLGVLLVVVSCGFGGPKKPKNLISKKNMVHILIDAKLLSTATFEHRNELERKGLRFNRYIFVKYGIDSLQFAESNNYYAYHIKDYEEIYANVTDSLERLKVALKEIELKEEKKKKKETDSINALKLKDSLKIQNKKDSLATKSLKKAIKKEEGVLINPASDNNPRSYK